MIRPLVPADAAEIAGRFAILDGDTLAGRINLTDVVRGPLLCANVGYFVDQRRNGRGLLLGGEWRDHVLFERVAD